MANSYRHGGRKGGAKQFFEDGFRKVFANARELTRSLITQSLSIMLSSRVNLTKLARASTGWETLLEGMIRSGWRLRRLGHFAVNAGAG